MCECLFVFVVCFHNHVTFPPSKRKIQSTQAPKNLIQIWILSSRVSRNRRVWSWVREILWETLLSREIKVGLLGLGLRVKVKGWWGLIILRSKSFVDCPNSVMGNGDRRLGLLRLFDDGVDLLLLKSSGLFWFVEEGYLGLREFRVSLVFASSSAATTEANQKREHNQKGDDKASDETVSRFIGWCYCWGFGIGVRIPVRWGGAWLTHPIEVAKASATWLIAKAVAWTISRTNERAPIDASLDNVIIEHSGNGDNIYTNWSLLHQIAHNSKARRWRLAAWIRAILESCLDCDEFSRRLHCVNFELKIGIVRVVNFGSEIGGLTGRIHRENHLVFQVDGRAVRVAIYCLPKDKEKHGHHHHQGEVRERGHRE